MESKQQKNDILTTVISHIELNVSTVSNEPYVRIEFRLDKSIFLHDKEIWKIYGIFSNNKDWMYSTLRAEFRWATGLQPIDLYHQVIMGSFICFSPIITQDDIEAVIGLQIQVVVQLIPASENPFEVDILRVIHYAPINWEAKEA